MLKSLMNRRKKQFRQIELYGRLQLRGVELLESRLVLASAMGNSQLLQLTGPTSPVTAGSPFDIKVDYQTTPQPEKSGGVGFRLFFNSGELILNTANSSIGEQEFSQINGLEFGAFDEDPQDPDLFDNDPATNKWIFFSWGDSSGARFPAATQPVTLLTLRASASASTHVNLVSTVDNADTAKFGNEAPMKQGTPLNISVALPEVTVVVSPSSVQEDGATNLAYAFTRTGDTSSVLTANFGVSGTAGFNADYAATGAGSFTASSGTVTFAAGSNTVTVTLNPTADVAVESDETAILTVTAGTGYTVGAANAVATGTIANDDAPPVVTIAVAPSSVQEDGSTNLAYAFTRTGDTSGALTANFGVSGTAGFNSDYAATGAASFTASSGTVTFAAGSSTTTVTLDPTADVAVESDETAILTVTAGTGYTVGTTNAAATGTITNDDAAALPVVTVAVSPSSVQEDGATNLAYAFTRTGDISNALTANFGISGTAGFNSDYAATGAASFTASSGTVTFAAGSNTATVTLDPTADAAVESDETAILTVTAGTGYTVGATNAAATGTITNDDAAALPVVTVAVSPSSVQEDGATNLAYAFTRTGDISSALTANFGVSGTAGFNSDYAATGAASFTASSGTVTFAAGSSTATVTLDPTTDAAVESDETAILTVTAGTGYTVGAANAVASGTIANDDAAVLSVVTVAVAPSSVQEDGSTNLVYTFTRTGDTSSALTANFGVSGTAGFNADYAATGAGSFTASSGTVTFAAGSNTVTVTLDPTTDTAVESDETAILTVTAGTGYTVGAANAVASGTIANDDVAGVPGFTVTQTDGSTVVSESGTFDTLLIVLNVQPSSNVVLTVTSSDTKEAAVTPRQLTFTSTNWNQPQTATVVGVIDGQVDGNQTRTITVSVDDASSDNAFDAIPDQTVSVTTLDAGFTIPVRLEVSETGTIDTFDIVLNAPPTSNVVLDVFGSDATEATVSPTSLVFTPINWHVPQTITVRGVDDNETDGNQQSTVTVSVDASNSDDAFDALPEQRVIVTTLDDEASGIGASLSGFVFADVNNNGTRDASENGIANVEVLLSGPVSRTTTTGQDGSYRFAGLPAGIYSVSETQPLAFLDGNDRAGIGSNGTAGNDVLSNINLSGQMNLQGYNFGERGLQARFISLNQFLARPSPADVNGLVFPANGEGEASGVAFRSSNGGLVTLSAEGEATLQLFDSSLTPLARSTAGLLTTKLEAGKGYVLYVAATGSSAHLKVGAATGSLLMGTIPLHNRMLTTDANYDGTTSPIDALVVINHLNHPAAGFAYPTFVDVNGDQLATPNDALQIINALNGALVNQVHAEGESSSPAGDPDLETSQLTILAVPFAIESRVICEHHAEGNRQADQGETRLLVSPVASSPAISNEPRKNVLSAPRDSHLCDDDLEAAISLIADDVGEFWQH